MITESIINKLNSFFKENPIAMGHPTSLDEILHIEKSLGLVLNEDFKDFTSRFGGCVVGDVQIYGIHNSELLGDDSIIDLNKQFSKYFQKEKYYFIIGTDGWGNPIYLDRFKHVVLYHHDTNENLILSDSFSAYLQRSLDRIN